MKTIYALLKSEIQNWHNGLQLTNIKPSMASELLFRQDDLLRPQGKGTTMPMHVLTNRQAENGISHQPSKLASKSPWNFRCKGGFRKLAKNFLLPAAVMLLIFTSTFTFMPIVASATVLSDMAASLAPGQWAELQTPTGIGAALGANGSSGHKLTYATVGGWNPINKRIYFCGMDHENAHQACMTYNDATHTWSILPTQPPWAGGTTPPYHGYDHNVVDANGQVFYHRPYINKSVFKCNIGSDPNCTSWSVAFTDSDMAGDLSGHAFAPWRGANGRMVYYSIYNSSSSIVKEWDPSTGTSTAIGTIPKSGTYGGIVVECSQSIPYICYLATDSTTLYTLNASGVLTARPAAPCSMHWNSSVSTVDPATGRLLTFCPGSLHEFNPDANTWRQVSGATPADQFVNQWSNGALVVPIPTYNVIIVIGANYGTADSTKKMWVYKHTATPTGSTDTQAPTIPGNLGATAASSSQINLTWSASNDNVGVTGYKVVRNGVQVGTATGTSYIDTGLSASTTNVYTVSAFDAAGNNSGQSSSASATTAPVTSSGSADFQTRCRAAGVLKCLGFDSSSDFAPAQWPNNGLYPAGDGQYRCVLDTAITASGAGSMRCYIPGRTGAQPSGWWFQHFGQTFGENSVFYVQVRQRFDAVMINTDWQALVGSYWKQLFFQNDAYSCGAGGLVTVSGTGSTYLGFPTMYSDCGTNPVFGSDGLTLQQGDVTNCRYPGPYTGCAKYPIDTWVTYYYRIQLGNWGQPNSYIQAWVALDGGPYKKWIDMPNFVYNADPAHPGINSLTLTDYMTNKNSTVDHPTANMWYDELIISTQPIAVPAPSGGGSSNPPPAAPANLRVQ